MRLQEEDFLSKDELLAAETSILMAGAEVAEATAGPKTILKAVEFDGLSSPTHGSGGGAASPRGEEDKPRRFSFKHPAPDKPRRPSFKTAPEAKIDAAAIVGKPAAK